MVKIEEKKMPFGILLKFSTHLAVTNPPALEGDFEVIESREESYNKEMPPKILLTKKE